ncbi:hypothetical protein HCJ66_05575 [Listeria sp. FSL L7-1582]|uniref:Uncharacterized protein n=1 Tax=Listeria weihenstephanensis TaxID=1006155 RepID=A0A1S7FRT1_9LIST|nr:MULTISPECIES: hypothetical protein [Listeria]AQY50151.1 hypothetical protein UE46_03280 [Listeria weihenstephanensis]EUJ34521.1 hypothetical protein PWEIH_16998 [Listeria weihenstephanensis FSL R9-0317]MBC6309019.1 hypothetical protein [Listeria portnoyi]
MKKKIIIIVSVLLLSLVIFLVINRNNFSPNNSEFRLYDQFYLTIGGKDLETLKKPTKQDINEQIGNIQGIWRYAPMMSDFQSPTIPDKSVVYSAKGFPIIKDKDQTYYARLIVVTPDNKFFWFYCIP